MRPMRRTNLWRRLSRVASLAPREIAFGAAALALKPVIRRSLDRRGLEPTLRAILRFTPKAPLSRGGLDVERAEWLVQKAFFNREDSCLPVSLVQFALHRVVGPEPTFVVGVRRSARDRDDAYTNVEWRDLERGPLDWGVAAHAWVERASGPKRLFPFLPILRRPS